MFSLANLGLYLYQRYIGQQDKVGDASEADMNYLSLLRPHLQHGSVVLRSLRKVGMVAGEAAGDRFSPLLQPCPAGWMENILLSEKQKQILVLSPKMSICLKDWVFFLNQQNFKPLPESCDPNYILFETCPPDNAEDFLERSFSIPRSKRVKVVDCAVPLAWKSGTPFGIIAECDSDSLNKLVSAFMEGTIVMDDMLELNQMICVDIQGNASRLLRGVSQAEVGTWTPRIATPVGGTPIKGSPMGSAASLRATWDSFFENIATTPAENNSAYSGSNESLAISGTDEACNVYEGNRFVAGAAQALADMEDKFTDASVEGLAADQEESVAMMEGVCGMDTDQSEAGAGEALSGPVEELAPEIMTPVKRCEASRGKPPNVLIYCGKKDSQRQFEAVKSSIQQSLNQDRYVIYHLKHDQIANTPWADNSLLLIIASEKVYDGIDQIFLDYFNNGGMIISFGSFFDGLFLNRVKESGSPASILSLTYKQWKDVAVICTRWRYQNMDCLLPGVSVRCLARDPTSGNLPIIAEAVNDLTAGVAILSQANLDKDAQEMAISPEIFTALKKANSSRCDILCDMFSQLGLDCSGTQCAGLTPGVLLSTSKERSMIFLESIQPRIKDGKFVSRALSLKLINDSERVPSGDKVSSDCLPLLIDGSTRQAVKFDFSMYQKSLQSKILGHTVIYADIMTTTMKVIDSVMMVLPETVGLVAIAGRQTGGRGRGGNAWLSPEGCATFSLHVRTSLKSTLGQHLGLLQHMAATAVVHSVRSQPGCQEIDVRVKWPNDIYYGRELKLGGVLVQSSIMMDTVHLNIGIGFNVSNCNPTICINDLISQQNTSTGSSMETFTPEYLIASTISTLEDMINKLNTEGVHTFLDLYYKYWLHSDTMVHLEHASGPEVKVLGIDDQGYLMVLSPEGTMQTLQPDGNSFDMMRNLIVVKTQ